MINALTCGLFMGLSLGATLCGHTATALPLALIAISAALLVIGEVIETGFSSLKPPQQ